MTDDPFVEAMKAEDAKWGDDPAALRETIVKLRERCEAYKGQVKAGSDEIDRLKAALRVVMNASNDPYEIARAALKGAA